jgi:hypothetical protein
MSLTVHPHPDGSRDEFQVMHAGLQIGSIKKMAMTSTEKIYQAEANC